jgi:hypothetical protein
MVGQWMLAVIVDGIGIGSLILIRSPIPCLPSFSCVCIRRFLPGVNTCVDGDGVLVDSQILFLFVSCSVLFCSVLFCSVLFCSVLFCSVLSYPVLLF